MSEPITAEWLHKIGFRWHQLPRQPDRHWLLWLGNVLGRLTSFEDLGIELAPALEPGEWFCWLRADTGHRYSRFIHIRHLRHQAELIQLIEALTGQPWNPANTWGGTLYTPEQMQTIDRSRQRLDHCLLSEAKWRDIERDDSRGRALPEHMQACAEKDSIAAPHNEKV